MIDAIKLRLKDEVYTLGLYFLIISLAVFCIPLVSKTTIDNTFGIFILNFLLTAIYFIMLVGNKRLRKHSRRIHTLFIFLLLFLISAFALNRDIVIFDNSSTWFCIVLVLVSVNYISFSILSYIPQWVRHVMSFLLAVSTIVFIYLGLYLLPYYPLSVAISFALGISIHTFVPLLFTIFSIVLIRKVTVRYPSLWKSFYSGIAAVVIFVSVFAYKWSSIVDTINYQYQNEISADESALPAWVRVAQKVPKGWISERILKTGLVYNIPSFDDEFFRMPSQNFGEENKHDPLVMISSLFAKRIQLSDQDKINILKSIYNSRNEAEERLWSGEHLRTEHINTTVQLMPAYRLAYTQEIITVANTNPKNVWNRQEEAIYTFHLPEGGVVSSLSLWIDGKEAKGVLTTKEKATKGYNTVVGVEQRDPSVLHWQEGNRVSVRVFPVVAGENRIFKVGVTSPLEKRGSRLVYSNIYFDGPQATSADENVKVECADADNISLPDDFDMTSKGIYNKNGMYGAEWSMAVDAKPMASSQFTFDGNAYGVQEYQVQREPVDIQRVYLDINAAWSSEEALAVFDMLKDKKVYVFNGEMQKLNKDNVEDVSTELRKQRFSLFPFFDIKDPEHSLVITKNAGLTPTLDDLTESSFYSRLKEASSMNTSYKVFQLGDGLSPYLQSLKELRWFQFEHGTIDELKTILENSSFAKDEENNDKVVVHNAAILLTKQPATANIQNAPDHLMRLFTYNHIMQQMGKGMLSDSAFNNVLVSDAEKANIVTPVSSLVVLETQEDYDRFDIKSSKNSLKNASLKSKGAVPEPHEWALIILVVLVLLYVKYPQLFKRKALGL